jgi:hypothetical protein
VPRHDRADDTGARLEGTRQVVRGYAHHPVLHIGHLLPVRVAQLLDYGHRLLNLRLELFIEAALSACRGRVSGPAGAAAKLGLPRQTRASKIKALGIPLQQFKMRPGD